MSGGVAPAANEFLRFSHKKTIIFASFFIGKGHAVSAVTINVFAVHVKKQKLG